MQLFPNHIVHKSHRPIALWRRQNDKSRTVWWNLDEGILFGHFGSVLGLKSHHEIQNTVLQIWKRTAFGDHDWNQMRSNLLLEVIGHKVLLFLRELLFIENSNPLFFQGLFHSFVCLIVLTLQFHYSIGNGLQCGLHTKP